MKMVYGLEARATSKTALGFWGWGNVKEACACQSVTRGQDGSERAE